MAASGPSRIGPYEILEKIGVGGMGEVYKGRDVRLERFVALKLLRPSVALLPAAKRRFLEEARAASRLDHPNIGTVYEVSETPGGEAFISMAYYDGPTLRALISGGHLDMSRALDIARQTGEGLRCAHESGVVHRDIKPGNIVVTQAGIAKILDFGLATLGEQVDATITAGVVGTPAYMSPEQARGERVDARSDIWSWGVVLYEMLTGGNPFSAPNTQAVLYRIFHLNPPTVRERRPEIPAAVAAVAQRAMAADLERRYPSMAVALKDLAAAVEGRPATHAPAPMRELPELSAGIPVLAVLPFRSIHADEMSVAFSEGLTEEVLSMVARSEHIRVLGHTSTFQFRDQQLTAADMGRRLGATIVLSGSVQRSGRRVRVNAQALEVANGLVRWSEHFDGDLEDVFAIQEKIARAIAKTTEDRLRISVTGPSRHIPKPEAQDLYLLGRYHMNRLHRSTPEALQTAVSSFQKAIEIDPMHAKAWCGLGDLYVVLGFWGIMPAAEARLKAQNAVTRALELDDTLAEAHTSMGATLMMYDWHLVNLAEREFKRAIELNPNYALAYFWYASNVLVPLGRIEEAERTISKALEIDPLSPVVRGGACGILGLTGNLERAIAEGRRALEIDPNFVEAHLFLGQAYVFSKQPQEAIGILQDALSRAGERPWVLSGLACAYAAAGREADARALLEKLYAQRQQMQVHPSALALAHLALGEDEPAIALIEQGYAQRDSRVRMLAVDPRFERIRSHPSIVRLMEEIAHGSSVSRRTDG